MKLLAITFFLLVPFIGISQEANYLLTPTNRTTEPVSIRDLIDTATTNSVAISIKDIQSIGVDYVDLGYHVYVNLYAEKTDVSRPALLHNIELALNLDVNGKKSTDSSPSNYSDTFSLKVNPLMNESKLAFYFGKDIQISPFYLYDLEEVTVSFDLTQIDTSLIELSTIYLEIYIDRLRYFTANDYKIEPEFYVAESGNANNELKKNEAIIKWDASENPSSYELEWIHIPSNDPSIKDSLTLDFTQNSVRSITSKNFLSISMLHAPGHIVARGRTKRPMLNADSTAILDRYVYSEWSLDDELTISTNHEAVLEIDYSETSPLSALNWQYASSYAKDSKKKEIVNYFDGTQRNRQTTTQINDFDGRTYLGDTSVWVNNKSTLFSNESYYNYNGDPVINIIPSPIIGSAEIGFQSNLNTFGNSKLVVSDYDQWNIDSIPKLNADSNGAAQYYSVKNQLLGVDSFASVIPNANGYPYTRTEYLKDGSGRIKAQYGIGEDLTKDNTKGNRYAYAKPTTSELESLFGSNIGLANFYKKNINIDPNGVMNISYIDVKGNTVATSIAGIPEGRSKLESIDAPERNFSENLLLSGAEEFYEDRNSYELSYPIFVTASSEYEFEYGFDILPYEACTNVNICFDCRYELIFQIVNEDNEIILEAIDPEIEFSHANCASESYQIDSISYSANGSNASVSLGVISLELSAQKKYTVIKKLSLLENEIEYDAQLYLDSSNCGILDFEYFLNKELDDMDCSVCTTPQEEKENIDPCRIIREGLKADFDWPNGEFTKDADSTDEFLPYIYDRMLRVFGCGNLERISMYTLENIFLTNFGIEIGLTFADYKEEYKEFLIHFHPTYCQLPICEQYHTEETILFDKLLEKSETPEEFALMAKNAGFITDDTLSLSFASDTTLSINGVLDSAAADTLLIRFDPIMKRFVENDLIKSYTNSYFAQDSATPYYSPYLNQVIRECTPSVSIEDTLFHVPYFNNLTRGCDKTDSIGITGLTKFYVKQGALQGIAKDEAWEYYRNMYLISKRSFVDDMISSISCFENFTDTFDEHPETQVITWTRTPFIEHCHDSVSYYHNPNINYDSALSYTTKYKHFIGTKGSLNGVFIAEGLDSEEALDSLKLEVNDVDKTVGKQVFRLLIAFGCMELGDSADFVNRVNSNLLVSYPFQYLDTLRDSSGIEFLNCDPWQINFSSVVAPFRKFYKDTLGNNYFSSVGTIKENINCSDFKQAHQEFTTYFHIDSVPSISEVSDIDFTNENQRRYLNFMNLNLGLNLAFYDYYKFAESCTLDSVSTFYGNIVIRQDSGLVAALKEVLILNDTTYYKQLENDSLIYLLNQGLSSTPYQLSDTLDVLGFGESNMSNNQFNLYLLENGKIRFSNFLDTLNWVFIESKAILELIANIEDTSLAYCRALGAIRYRPIDSASNLLIDRAAQYSNGTIWVRVINSSDSSLYNDFYFYYPSNNYLYQMDSQISSFTDIVPIFDQVQMHHGRLKFNLDSINLEMLIRTSKPIATSKSLLQIELADYQGRGEFPLYQTCEDLIYIKAKTQARIKFEKYIEGIKDTFKLDYINFCTNKKAVNSFSNQYLNINYQSSERQFTLYYYDQANNLVMTVPPGGIDTNFQYTTSIAQQIKDYRLGIANEVLPSHSKTTKYRYNSENQIIESNTPNGGTTNFWYDKAGRLVLSQKENQKSLNQYSHVFYDSQSRIEESGQIEINDFSGLNWITIQAALINEILDGIDIDIDSILSSKMRTEVTRIYYDTTILNNPNILNQTNLRSRVATQAYYPSFDSATSKYNWQYAIHYSYDPTGNVISICNDYYQRGGISDFEHRFKRIDYAFDVLSGNVNQVYYQTGKNDGFYHRYEYDAENRITKVETSRDGIIWDEDAEYEYYLHGPLSRLELGNQKVQGIDYAYTIQGYLKAFNSSTANSDMGNDNNKNSLFPSDVFGMALQYNEKDYEPIGVNKNYLVESKLSDSLPSLYNGNIAAVLNHNQDSTVGKAYRYDQLNRIRLMQEQDIYEDSLTWGSIMTNGNRTFYDYDPNGNLIGLIREDGASEQVMDNFSYNYIEGKDQLSSVDDTVSSQTFTNDIDQQVTDNYSYDAIGNLVSDSSEDISVIRWYNNGKVKKIIRFEPTEQRPNLTFEYDPLGNRVKKQIKFLKNGQTFLRSTYYVRDAQGNVMATYEERDCDFYGGDDSLGIYYYQFTEDYAYYTLETIDSINLDSLIQYLTYTYSLKTELCNEAFLNLYQVDSIRDTIISDLILSDYIDLYPAVVNRIVIEDPITYADDLFNNEQSSFITAMNEDNDAWIEFLRTSSQVVSFYNSIDALYSTNYGTNTSASKFFETNQDVISECYLDGDLTLLKDLLEVSISQYSTLASCYGDHSLALTTMLSWMNNLQSNLQNNINTQATYDLLDQVNAALLFIDFTTSDLSYILQGINNQGAFFSALSWLPSVNASKLNAILYHYDDLGSPVFGTIGLNGYEPTASMDWSADSDGDYLKHLIKLSVADPAVLNIFYNSSYNNGSNLTSSNVYYTNSTTLKNYALNILLSQSTDLTTTFGQKIKSSVIGLSANSIDLIEENEDIVLLMNYYKNYHPVKVLYQNYYLDTLNSALGGILGNTPYNYADQLRNDLAVSFNLSENCSTSQKYLVEENFIIYGSNRLGVVDAKLRSKDADNKYSRKLGGKDYEMSDHLGNVVATISDKKLHPQELLTNGDYGIDTTLGFQADVTGRYDYYPFGMEIMSRSGNFKTVDYSMDLVKLIYQGLLRNCGDYTTSNYTNTSNAVYCVTDENLYGQSFVDTMRIDHYDAPWFGRHKFDFYIDFNLGEIIPHLDTTSGYRLEIDFNSQGRLITASIPWDGVQYSPSEGSGATSSEIRRAVDKRLTFNFSGKELDSLASNGVVHFKFKASWGENGYPYDKYAEITDIRVFQIDENSNVPLAMRDGSAYSYGFQGQERDDEIKGSGNSVNYKYRMHDPRLGRFFAVDPIASEFPHNSPYAFSENRVIDGIEFEGLEVILIGGQGSGGVGIAGGGEGGIMLAPDGIFKYSTVMIGVQSNAGGSSGLAITYYNKMKNHESATGWGFDGGAAGGEGVVGGGGASYSGGYWGLNFMAGVGAGVFPVELEGYATYTKAGEVSDPKKYLGLMETAVDALGNIYESNQSEISNLSNQLNNLSDNASQDERDALTSEIDELRDNNSSITKMIDQLNATIETANEDPEK